MLALRAAQQSGDLSTEEFLTAGATTVATADDHAVSLGDLAIAAALTALRGEPVDPAGIVLPDQTDRLTSSLSTILADSAPDDADGTAAIARLGTAEPLSAGQWATGQALQAQDAGRWRRMVGPDPCPICTDLEAGTVPADVAMWSHPGCSCVQVPVTD